MPQEVEITEVGALPYPEPRTVFLGGIFFLMLMAALHMAANIIIPIVLAFMLKLALGPVQRFLEARSIPRTLAALLVVALLLGGSGMLVTMLSTPAADWIGKVSDGLPQVRERLSFLKEPIQSAKEIIVNAENMALPASGPKVMPVAIEGTRLFDRMFMSTRELVTSLGMTILMLFFLLVSGDTFLRRLVEILPSFSEKRQAVDISQQIQQDIAVYLLTVTFMNAVVGVLTGATMALCGRGDPVLWGTCAFLLNFVPIIGPMTCFALFAFTGLMTEPGLSAALLPALIYIVIHTAESSFITPLLLAKRFTLNPVVVILSLVFWYWMWGLAGAILAVPMLAIAKIICDRVERLKPVGHFLEN
ncbi:MAG: AI-2E family transporter [Alphaproteobacteria bacterium]